MGHIQKRADRRYRARWLDPDGRERSRTFTRETDAERQLAAVEGAKLSGAYASNAVVQWCVSASADLLILDLASTCQGRSSTSMARRSSMALDDHWNYNGDLHSPMISSNSAAPVFAILRPK
jgi:hypothetical protein